MSDRLQKVLLRMGFIFIGLLVLLLVAVWYSITQPLLIRPDKVEPVAFDAIELRSEVEYIVNRFYPRNEQHPRILHACAKHIHTRFLESTPRVQYQKFFVNGKEFRNVVASFGPQSGERIIVGAHYDVAGDTPGADDNATGIAALIALSRKLKHVSLSHRIDLVAYSLEEPPYFKTKQMGSAWHAMEMQAQNVPVKLMVSLEMLGFYSSAPHSQSYPSALLNLFYPSKGNFIAVVGRIGEGAVVKRVKGLMASATSIDVYSINAPRFIPGIDFSDHLNYWDAGFAAVMISDTAFYRNKAYHTSHDQINTLDFETMSKVLSGIYNLILNY